MTHYWERHRTRRRLLNEMAGVTDIVGLGITEHLPWDALALRDILRRLPLLGSGAAKAVS